MNIEVSTLDFKSYPLSDNVSKDLEGNHIPGSKVIYSQGAFGFLFSQEITLNMCSILYSILHAEEKLLLNITFPEPLVQGRLMLKGSFNQNVNGETVSFKEGQFYLTHISTKTWTSLLEEQKDYILLDFNYPSDFILQKLAYYPALEKFKEDVLTKKSSLITNTGIYITAHMFNLADQILHSPYSSSTKRFHTDIMKEVLTRMLEEAVKESPANLKYSLENIENIYAARSYIDSHLSHHDTIFQIARKVGLNEQKLKKGFKEIFGIGVYGYSKQERLKIAKAELEQTRKSIKEISRNAGYKNANNFSISFKKAFGISPLQIRKRN